MSGDFSFSLLWLCSHSRADEYGDIVCSAQSCVTKTTGKEETRYISDELRDENLWA